MNNQELAIAAKVLAEGWFQRNHPDSPGVTISDDQMIEAAYEVRATLASDEGTIRVNRTQFSSWASGALDETIVQAERFLAVHDGDFAKALEAIADLAGGNISLQCRAHYRPIERVLQSAIR